MTEALKVKEQKMQEEREEQIGQYKKQTADWLQTIVFRVRKQWDYCCLVAISMLKTMVCSSLHFELTEGQMVCDEICNHFVLLGFT